MRGAAALLSLALAACTPAPEPAVPAAATEWSEAERARIATLSLARLPPVPADPGNRVADDPRAAALGAALFGDPRLSRNGRVACASCHDPARDFTDGRPRAQGLGPGRRHTPSLVGVAWSPWLFWDGRADSLWAQALGPLMHDQEQGLTPASLKALLEQHYRGPWEALFGPLAGAEPARVAVDTAKAIAAFERTLRPAPSRFDRYAEALERAPEDPATAALLAPAERRGLRLFLGRGQCLRCHSGPLFSNQGFHNTGLPRLAGEPFDPGRAEGLPRVLASAHNCRGPHGDAPGSACPHLEYARVGADEWLGAFKTPGLRNVARTAPYLHDGRFATLAQLLDHYNRAPGVEPRDGHGELFPLGLSEAELSDLAAFLGSLSALPPPPGQTPTGTGPGR